MSEAGTYARAGLETFRLNGNQRRSPYSRLKLQNRREDGASALLVAHACLYMRKCLTSRCRRILRVNFLSGGKRSALREIHRKYGKMAILVLVLKLIRVPSGYFAA
jgi:hypothetical protein